MTRADEPGWRLAAMNDVSGRRGIWFKFDAESSSLEICAGREGDDCYVKLVANSHLSMEAIQGLRGILDTGAWMVDDAGEIGCFRILEIAGRYREQHKKVEEFDAELKKQEELATFIPGEGYVGDEGLLKMVQEWQNMRGELRALQRALIAAIVGEE